MPEPPKISILHCVLSMDVGGLERIVLDLVCEGRRMGQDVAVVCLERRGALAPAAEALGARVMSVGKRPGLRPATIGRLAAAFRTLGPGVIHTHQVGALAYAGPAAKLGGGAPVVHTEHGKHYAGRLRTRLLGRMAGRFAARFCCVSGDVAAEAEACRIVPRSKIHVVPNGIDTDRFATAGDPAAVRAMLEVPPEAPLVGTVGRLNEVKRQDRLIRGFARALGRAPDAHLVLVGDGPLMMDFRSLAEGLGIASRVHFAGYQAEPERFLGAMDVFALTSRSEGMPLAVLEAWASGVPVVASRVGGLPEMIDDGRTGLLVDAEDEGALASAIVGLVADPDSARRIGAAGRELARARYDVRTMSGAYDRHYRELLSAGGSTS